MNRFALAGLAAVVVGGIISGVVVLYRKMDEMDAEGGERRIGSSVYDASRKAKRQL